MAPWVIAGLVGAIILVALVVFAVQMLVTAGEADDMDQSPFDDTND